MKILFTATLLFVFTANLLAQKPKKEVPKSFTKSIALLSVYLTKDIRSQEGKVEAIYEWITNNIAFDYDALMKGQYSIVPDPKETLKRRKAISPGYVELMKAMLDYIEIENESVTGYIHDLHWFPGKLVMEEGHTWLAVKINGQWKFVDPTWDAGYIGRIPKKVKPYKAKKYLINKWKKPEKEAKVKEKREEKELERKKKYDEKPGYTNKIGFVKAPAKDYFFIHRDTFLLSHIPTLPMWQLRESVISLKSFSKSEDSLIMDIEANVGERVNVSGDIQAFQDKDYFEQLLYHGERGYAFNPYNPWVKVRYYYEFMAIIHNKQLQKLARGSVYEITESKYNALAARADTILKYGKLYKNVEKDIYKSDKTFDKEQYKLSADRDKENSKLTRKVASEYEKMSDKIKSNSNTLEKNIDRLSSLMSKIEKDYEKAIDYEKPESLDTNFILEPMASIRDRMQRIERRTKELSDLRAKSSFNGILTDAEYINRLLFYNEQYIRVNSYSTSEWVAEVDSLIKTESNHFIGLITDSVPNELLDKELLEELRVIEEICKTAKIDLNQLKGEGKIDFPYKYELFLQAMYADAIRAVKQTHLQSLNFNQEVAKALKSKKGTVSEMESRMKKQDDLKEKNYEYIEKMTEKEHERKENYLKEIEKDAKAWKAKYSGK